MINCSATHVLQLCKEKACWMGCVRSRERHKQVILHEAEARVPRHVLGTCSPVIEFPPRATSGS